MVLIVKRSCKKGRPGGDGGHSGTYWSRSPSPTPTLAWRLLRCLLPLVLRFKLTNDSFLTRGHPRVKKGEVGGTWSHAEWDAVSCKPASLSALRAERSGLHAVRWRTCCFVASGETGLAGRRENWDGEGGLIPPGGKNRVLQNEAPC